MKKEVLNIKGHECIHYVTNPEAETLLVQLIDEHDLKDMDNELATIVKYASMPLQLVAFKVNDWQTELTPWTAPPVFGKVPFGDKAPETLRFITDDLLPALSFKRVLLGGYSLAGLFALWAGYQTDVFDGIAAASPSVWYPDWIAFAENHQPQTSVVYLSLGDKEHKTKNAVMARISDCIRLQQQLLRQQGIKAVLEWNEGNHFRDADLRMARGFAWLINQSSSFIRSPY